MIRPSQIPEPTTSYLNVQRRPGRWKVMHKRPKLRRSFIPLCGRAPRLIKALHIL